MFSKESQEKREQSKRINLGDRFIFFVDGRYILFSYYLLFILFWYILEHCTLKKKLIEAILITFLPRPLFIWRANTYLVVYLSLN
jgi:hypothetical protein